MVKKHRGIEKVSNGKFRVRYCVAGRRYTLGTFPTLTIALERQKQLERDIALGVWVSPQERAQAELLRRLEEENNSVTVASFSRRWLAEGDFKAGTVRAYSNRVNKWIVPLLGEIRLRDLGSKDVKEFMCQVARATSKKNANIVLANLASMLQVAIEEGIISVNPALGKGLRYKDNDVREKPVLTDEQLEVLKNNIPPCFRFGIILGGELGLRIGEVLALRRCDIDLDNAEVTIRATVARDEKGATVINSPKSRAGYRSLPLNDRQLEEARTHLSSYVPSGREMFIFQGGSNGNKPRPARTVGQWLERVIKAPCYDFPPGVTFHCLRHTALTHLAQKGATLAELKTIAGHSNIETVAIYQHATKERLRGLLEL